MTPTTASRDPILTATTEATEAAGKNFEYRIYTNAPGGHAFNRLDTKFAHESRREIYEFLAKHLKPANPPK